MGESDVSAYPGGRRRALKVGGTARLLLFPILINTAPILLFLSQKALVPVGTLLLIRIDRKLANDYVVVALLATMGGVSLLFQEANEYSRTHYLGYLAFLLSVPLINEAVRKDADGLRTALSALSLANIVFAIGLYIWKPDLSSVRGLNLVNDTFGTTERVYLETTSLFAVFTVNWIRRRLLRAAAILLVIVYLVFLAKSLFVIMLALVNWLVRRGEYGGIARVLGLIGLVTVGAFVVPMVLLSYRPDFLLSVGVKFLQLQTIVAEFLPYIAGHGWGYYIPEIATSPEQPYQVEMQLPMMVAQLGFPLTLAFLAGMSICTVNAGGGAGASTLRSCAYAAVGFINPWLLVPSWYLTTSLLFRESGQASRASA